MSERLVGTVDFHVHTAPDDRPRYADAVEVARSASDNGMVGLVLKCHQANTAAVAGIVAGANGIGAIGGVALNRGVGGLNPVAVETCLAMGGKVVWFPTHDARNERYHRGLALEGGLSIRDDRGELRDDVRTILALCAERGAVVSTGHLAPADIVALHQLAREHRVERFVVTHPDHRHVELPPTDQIALARSGALMERIIPRPGVCRFGLDELVARIRAVGVSSNVLGSDLGQPENGDPVLGFGRFLDDLHAAGLSDPELETIAGEVPARLLDLDRGRA